MKRFIITSDKFLGEVQLLYGDDLRLLDIDFRRAAGLADSNIHFIKSRAPVLYDKETFIRYFEGAPLRFVQEGYTITFQEFWDDYGKMVNRKRCEAKWDKLSTSKQVAAYFGLMSYNRFLDANRWRSKADPETFLAEEYWLTDWTKVKS